MLTNINNLYNLMGNCKNQHFLWLRIQIGKLKEKVHKMTIL